MIGYAICGSFCTHKKALEILRVFKSHGHNILPVLSENSYNISTRFGTAEEFRKSVEEITENTIIHTIEDSEPIGPMYKLDALVIAPCSGNTLAKMAHGITDTYVTPLLPRIYQDIRKYNSILKFSESSQRPPFSLV